MNPCMLAKAAGEPALPTNHQTSSSVPTDVPMPLSRFMIDRTDVSCGR